MQTRLPPRANYRSFCLCIFTRGGCRAPRQLYIHLLLHYFILWQDSSEKRREDRQAFEEYIERLKIRVAELEEKLYESRTEACQMKAELDKMRAQKPDPEINRLMKQVQNFRLEEKMQRAHDEVGVLVCLCTARNCMASYSICACNGPKR